VVGATETGQLSDVIIAQHRLTWFTANRRLNAATPQAIGIVIGRDTDVVTVAESSLDGFGTQISVDSHAPPMNG
jgi:hypothetical protein